ncbi:hypothetical protein R1sor_006385 [Riccia sorocarpa]|uniref:Uncharacterized protein n=1 Tax=Riccia sorocarpa TaxID=122646 RepID=A0ABD3HTQ5_9MARC
MGRKSYKDVISLVCCSDATFTEFENFVAAWEKGEIPYVYGALGKPKGERDVGEVLRDFSQLSVNRFRPVNGLPDEDLKLVWSQLAQGSVWVSRPAKYQGPEDIVALKEYCKALKGKDKLGKAILAVFYTIPEPWLGEMLKYLPYKPEKEVVTEDVSSSDGDDEDSSKKKKKPKKKSTSVDVLPSQIKTQLHKFHCAKHGVEIPQRLEPLEVLHIKDITQYQLTLDEKHDCKLVFLDLTHLDLVNWEKQEFSCFLGIVKELTSSEGFVIVAVMDFGKPLLVHAYVSFGPEDYKPSLSAQPALHPTSNEYETQKGLADMVLEKGEGAEPMVINYSKAESTVLDFFSGGIFAREALLFGRDVIYFANSEPESVFLKEYGKALVRYSDSVRSWFQRYKSLKLSYLFEPAVRYYLFEPAARCCFYEPTAGSRRYR